jgi:hypothetical protein
MIKNKYFKNKPKTGGNVKKLDGRGPPCNPVQDPLAPTTPSRILLCGPYGCGKTNLLLNLIYYLLPWSKLYVYAKDLEEEKHVELKSAWEQAKLIDKDFEFIFDISNIVKVDELNPDEHNLIIFDDFICDKSSFDDISELFTRGRKKNATLIFLTQSYFDTPKIIRLQCNYMCFCKLNDHRELADIYQNHPFGLSKKDFTGVLEEATRTRHSFLFLDTMHKNPAFRIRKNLNEPINICIT